MYVCVCMLTRAHLYLYIYMYNLCTKCSVSILWLNEDFVTVSFCSLGMASVWLCGRLGVLSRRRGSGLRVVTSLAPLVVAACIAMSRSCDYHHHWQGMLSPSSYLRACSCRNTFLHSSRYIASSLASLKLLTFTFTFLCSPNTILGLPLLLLPSMNLRRTK